MNHPENRQGDPQAWNHASMGGQPALRPLNTNGLKPLTPINPAPPAAAPFTQRPAYAQPTPAPQRPANSEPTPAPVWQPARPIPPIRQNDPVPAWTPATRPASPPPSMSPLGAFAPDEPSPATPAITAAPVPLAMPATPAQGAAPAQPQPEPDPAQNPSERRVWMQTISQQSPQAQQGTVLPPQAEPAYANPEATLWAQAEERAEALPAVSPDPSLATQADANTAAPPTGRRRRASAQRAYGGAPETPAPGGEQTPMPAYAPAEAPTGALRELSALRPPTVAATPAYPRPAAQAVNADPKPVPQTQAPLTNQYQTPAYRQAGISGDTAPQSLTPADPYGIQEDDSARFTAVERIPLAEPRPVPTFEPFTPKRSQKHRLRNGLLITLAVLAVALAALYATGVLNTLLGGLLGAQTGDGGVPTVFEQETAAAAGQSGIVPASKVTLPQLRGVTVDPQSATAPATLVFTLETNAATSAIRLLTEANATIKTVVSSTPKGDGLIWLATADWQEPYAGKVRVFLRDEAGQWAAAEQTCQVTVR